MDDYERQSRVIAVFHQLFHASHRVHVQGGFDEPFYRAPRDGAEGEIQYRHDYLNSCLHEIAHWLLAGEGRLAQDDFGYWYAPDGRNAEEQAAFYRAEVKPQALEWSLADLCGAPFRISADNIAGQSLAGGQALETFTAQVADQKEKWRRNGYPERAARFLEALKQAFCDSNGSIVTGIKT
jgi:elongation factor P hydroxylase